MDLSLPYRSNRNYIHSADIFQSLTDVARRQFDSNTYVESLVLRRQAARQVRVAFEAMPQAIGTFSFRVGNERVRGWLAEADADIRVRVPYDESRATAAVVGGPGFARFVEPVTGYTAFEQLVVLLKVAGGQGRRDAWLCQANLQGPLLDTKPLAVRLRLRAMVRFFAFEVLQDEQLIGAAYAALRS
jgi:hypothetical protein